MEKINLKAQSREISGKKVKQYRKKGKVPAVLYGKGVESKNLWVDLLDLRKAYKGAGESAIIELDIDGKNKENILIYDAHRNPLSGDFLHVDFFRVKMDEKIETSVPLKFTGVSLAVKEQGGILMKNIDEIPVKCLPADLPSEIKVDLGSLKTFEDRIGISDINVGGKVEILLEGETIVVSVAPPRSEEELAGLDEKIEEDVSAVEGVEKEVVESGEATTTEKEIKKEKNKEEK